jgi:CheY-like chemotaxis protein
MDAIGQLAGGVAHDFNNLLTAILGNTEMLEEALSQSSSDMDPFVAEALREIGLAGQRAASLTRQLLAFGRKQVRQLEVLAPSEIVSGLEPMLRPLIGERIRFDTKLDPDAPKIHVDLGQIEQVVINLAINARDAMPGDGTLEIGTSAADLDDRYVEQHPGARPGPHAVISVSDDGVGMSSQTREQMFEPFFTTKPVGKGTGLGLATVYGIVSQAGGHILTDSRPGRGTTIRVLIPAAAEAEAVGEAPARVPTRRRGRETILLCEDERMVRRLARQILESVGYTVLEAEDGKRALGLEAGYPGTIDLLVTDTILPGMNGRVLAENLVARRPAARVLYVSGYTHDVIASEGVLENDLAFLQKPFSATSLLDKVHKILDTRES